MKIFENIRRFFREESPIKENKIMCRAGGYTHKKNIQNTLLIFMLIGIIFGRVISEVTNDVINAIGNIGYIGVLIGVLIGGYIGVLIGKYVAYIGGFIGGFIGGYIAFFIALFIGFIIIGDTGVTRSNGITTGDIIFIVGILLLLLRVIIKFIPYYKWHLGYLGELVVANELYKVGEYQQWRIFHGLKSGESDIDHIVVCTKGVFLVETKMRRKYSKVNEKINFKNDEIYIHVDGDDQKLEDNTVGEAQTNATWLLNKINEHCYEEPKKLESVIPIIAFPGWNIQGEGAGAPNEKIVVCDHEQIVQKIVGRKGDPLSNKEEFDKICRFLEKATETKIFDNR